jgi:hypothetical protein
MSAIADFVLIQKSKLPGLKQAAAFIDGYWDFIQANSTPLKDYNWSGYVMLELIIFLQEQKEINLMENEYQELMETLSAQRENSTYLFTLEQKNTYLNQINTLECTMDELIAFNMEYSAGDDKDYAMAQLNSIQELAAYLEQLTHNDQVILLSIG